MCRNITVLFSEALSQEFVMQLAKKKTNLENSMVTKYSSSNGSSVEVRVRDITAAALGKTHRRRRRLCGTFQPHARARPQMAVEIRTSQKYSKCLDASVVGSLIKGPWCPAL